MKKKILALCLVVVLAVTAVTGATLAYFTDTDKETNVFTTGKVDIEIHEVFDPDNAKLLPGIDINKDVYVYNETGSEQAYVRVHIAFPSILDSGATDDPAFAAYANTLHWNFTKESLVNGQWNWGVSADAANYPGNGGAWNSYEAEIDGVDYTVYVATYETILGAEEKTATQSLDKVYLDVSIDDEELQAIKDKLGEIKVLVWAEGGQAAGFEDAFTALNTQFGNPMAAGYTAPWNQA